MGSYGPYRTLTCHFLPYFGTEAQDQERTIMESKNRLWKRHQTDPSSHWIYVVEGKRIIGVCQWRIYLDNPFPDPRARVNMAFWPEGTGRDFASEVATHFYGQRKAWMGRTHAGLSLMCVLPEKRRQGVGGKLMEWRLDKMNERDIEGFVEASLPGRLLYWPFGFLDVAYVRVNMDHNDLQRTEAWRELERTRLPLKYKAMWGSSGGKQLTGEAAKQI